MRKTVVIFFLMAVISASSCYSENSDYYEGYIYLNKKPVNNAKISEKGSHNYTITNDKGYFKLKRNSREVVLPIIVEKDNVKDSIDLRRSGGADAKIDYLLVAGNKDTIELDRERIFKRQSSQ